LNSQLNQPFGKVESASIKWPVRRIFEHALCPKLFNRYSRRYSPLESWASW
jgi:hypothetical protein